MPALRIAAACAAALFALPVVAGDMLIEDFITEPGARWDYVSDRVMGGVSDGSVAFVAEDGRSFVRLTGQVSTKNNGGFLQVRRRLDVAIPPGTNGVALTARGNGDTYFVHIRTSRTVLPWHYYQVAFSTDTEWQTVRLPFSSFKGSSAALPSEIAPETVKSIGIVAFGRNYAADVSITDIALF